MSISFFELPNLFVISHLAQIMTKASHSQMKKTSAEQKAKDEKKRSLNKSPDRTSSTEMGRISLKPDVEYTKLYSLGVRPEESDPKYLGLSSVAAKKSKKKEEHSQNNNERDTAAHTAEQNPDSSAIAFTLPSGTIQLLHLLLDYIVSYVSQEVSLSEQELKANANQSLPAINLQILIKTIHIIVKKHPILVPFVTKHNVTKTVKKNLKSKHWLERLPNPSQVNFLSFFLRVISVVTFDKFRHFIYLLCLDSPVIIERKESYQLYSSELRRRIVSEIYSQLDEEASHKDFLSNLDSKQIFCSLSCLLTYILPLKEVVRYAVPTDYSATQASNSQLPNSNNQTFNFLRVYSEALKRVRVSQYYEIQNIVPFIVAPLTLLVQFQNYVVLHKDQFSNLASISKSLSKEQSGKDQTSKHLPCPYTY